MSIVADRPATKIPSGTWSIDPVWSALEFEVKKIGLINVKGRVLGFTGTIRGRELTRHRTIRADPRPTSLANACEEPRRQARRPRS